MCALYRQKEKKLYIAWVGDSIATLWKNGTPLCLVNKHVPERYVCYYFLLILILMYFCYVFPNTISEYFDSITMSFSISKNLWYLVNLFFF